MHEILIVEDEVIIRDSLSRLLRRNDFSVTAVGSVDEAIREGLQGFDLIVADLRLPGAEGTSLIPQAKSVPVLIMTSYSSVQSAVDAMKQGAADYIAKPYNHDDMVLTIQRILKRRDLEQQNCVMKREIDSRYPIKNLMGESNSILQVKDRIQRVAQTQTSVLILGETGTGKELTARAIHAQSTRANKPLISINCASIPENLIESELFGHEKGAFTGALQSSKGLIAAADSGTLFLDEIGELSPEAQAQLLRVLQEGEIRRVGSNKMQYVDIRLIAATHRNLMEMVKQKLFREDLYYRLNVMEITLPPLRERVADILPLAEQILHTLSTRLQRANYRFDKGAIKLLQEYRWPGNVRELENIIERSIILSNDQLITAQDLGLQQAASTPTSAIVSAELSLDEYFVEFVKEHQQHLNETELSARLGISRKNLWERRMKLGIPRP
ncbi:MAG: sigma-54-dependent Fis family transcriptional regulator [Gammaproteobacteria bacterium]|nr:sigma-54-dependent Fis family transcriptional regulator [Gammaproteobacteria bacterium]MBL6999744.1 sigma-54-dependent Fis family transcriptional regulator [Gammaproteobacteria bacterium]